MHLSELLPATSVVVVRKKREKASRAGPGTWRCPRDASRPNGGTALAPLCPRFRDSQACRNLDKHRRSAPGSGAGWAVSAGEGGCDPCYRAIIRSKLGLWGSMEIWKHSDTPAAPALPEEAGRPRAEPHRHERNPCTETPSTRRSYREERPRQQPWLSPPTFRKACSGERDGGPGLWGVPER